MSIVSVKQSCNVGDLISMLPALRQLSKHTGKKVQICQRVGMVGSGMSNSIHPFQNEQGYDVCMNDYMFNMVAPLIKHQDWVYDFVKYEGQPIEIDLDVIRSQFYTPMAKYAINRWLFFVYPQMICDLSSKFLYIPKAEYELKATGKIIINRTQRYFNNYTTYFFLKKYEPYLIFAGLPKEREIFCKEWNLDMPLLEVDNFLQLAQEIDNCKFYIGNQSQAFQIAEGLKKQRVLEVFEPMPNVVPMGANGYEFLHQEQLEFIVSKLFAEC